MERFVKIILGLIVFTPLIVFQGVFFPFVVTKTLVFEALVLIASFFWLYLWIKNPARYAPRITSLVLAISLYIFVMLIAGFGGLNFWKSFWSVFERMDGIFTWIMLFVFFLLLDVFYQSRKDWILFFRLMLFASIWADLQAMNFFGIFSGTFKLSTHIIGLFGSPIYVGVYALFHITLSVLLFSFLFSSDTKMKNARPLIKNPWTFFYAAGFLINVLTLLLSFSRGPIVGFFIGCIVFISLYLFYGSKKTLALKALAIIGLLLLLTFPFWKNSEFVARISSISKGFSADPTRAINWNVAIDVFRARPILGWGSNSYFVAQNDFFNPRLSSITKESFDRVHNKYLEIAVESGIIGLIAYLFIFTLVIFTLIKRVKRESFSSSLLIGVFVAYLIQNITAFDNPGSYLPLFIFLAFVNKEFFSPLASFRAPRINSFALVIGGLIIFSFLWQGIWQPFMANLALADTLVRQTAPSKDYNTILSGYKLALSYQTLGDYEARLRLGLFLSNSQEVSKELLDFGIQELEKEAEISDHEVLIRVLLGKLYMKKATLENNDVAYAKKIEDEFLRAIKLSPARPETHEHYAIFLLNARRQNEAREEFFKIKALNEDFFNTQQEQFYFGLTYYTQKNLKAAYDIFQQILKNGGNFSSDQELLVMGKLTFELKKYDEMVKWYEALMKIEKNSDNVQYRKLLAAAYAKVGNNAGAIDQAKYIAKVDPTMANDVQIFIKSLRR